jgi:predicted DNA-binding WGR domain protein
MKKESIPHIQLKDSEDVVDLYFEFMTAQEKKEFFHDLLKHRKIKLLNNSHNIIDIEDIDFDDFENIKKFLNQNTNKPVIEYDESKHRFKQVATNKGKQMNNLFIKKMATSIIKQAMPMLVLDPARGMARTILQALRNELGVDPSMKPLWREYVTIREGASNKFHYFVVFVDNNGKFRAANAYGRIGYTPKVFDLGTFDTANEAMSIAKNKLRNKMSKGYQPTSFDAIAK